MKFLIALLVLAIAVAVVYSMLRSWQSRSMHRATVLAPFPPPPAELTGPLAAALLPPVTGVYVGTSMAGDWQDQVDVGDIGVQATATLHLSGAGLLVDRAGASPLWIAADAMRGARLGRSIAGTVLSADGLLVVTWQLGGHLLDTAFRFDEESYPQWLETLRALVEGRVMRDDGVPGDDGSML